MLPGCIPERTAYREAHNRGQAVTETKHKALNERVDELMEGLYARVAAQLQARAKRSEVGAQEEGSVMSRDDDVGKTLGTLARQGQEDRPAAAAERGDEIRSTGPSSARVTRGDDGLTQLNFKIPHSTKKRIKQLAVRDNITLLIMLDRMLELYEKEHGKLGEMRMRRRASCRAPEAR